MSSAIIYQFEVNFNNFLMIKGTILIIVPWSFSSLMLIIFVSVAGEQIRAFFEWGERKIAEPCRIEANENWKWMK